VKSEMTYAFALAVFLISSAALRGREQQKAQLLVLDKLKLHNVRADPVTYLGGWRRASLALRTTSSDRTRIAGLGSTWASLPNLQI
jgi:hypothetical protein